MFDSTSLGAQKDIKISLILTVPVNLNLAVHGLISHDSNSFIEIEDSLFPVSGATQRICGESLLGLARRKDNVEVEYEGVAEIALREANAELCLKIKLLLCNFV